MFCKEGKSVWWHIRGLSGKEDPNHPNQKIGHIDTDGKLGSSMYKELTPKRIAERRSEGRLYGILHTCRQCRVSIEEVFEAWEEIDAL